MDFLNQFSGAAIQNSLPMALPIVFIAGVISSFGPCIFTTLPLAVGYMGNSDIQDRKRGVFYAGAFTAGLSLTFVILGILTAFLGMILLKYSKFLTVALALVMIFSALYMLDVLNFKKKQNVCSIEEKPRRKGVLGIFLLGMFGGFASTPCATPVLAAILSFVTVSGNVLFGALLLLFYSLGHSVLYFAAGLSISSVNKLILSPKYMRYGKYMRVVLAVLVFVAGVYLFYTVV